MNWYYAMNYEVKGMDSKNNCPQCNKILKRLSSLNKHIEACFDCGIIWTYEVK